jgi:hypothetical protein
MTRAGFIGVDQGTDQGLTRARRKRAESTLHGITTTKTD